MSDAQFHLAFRRTRGRVPRSGDGRSKEARHWSVAVSADGVDWLLNKPTRVLDVLRTFLFNTMSLSFPI